MRGVLASARWVFLLLLVLGGFALGGCASTEPQNWENGLPSGMYDQYR
jgi:hypothetical protein